MVDVTIGKLIFNENMPQDLGFVDRKDPDHALDLEIDFLCTKKMLGVIIDRCIKVHGIARTAELLDVIKSQGFKYSTKGAITISVADIEVPEEKATLIAEAEKKVDTITRDFRRGLISDDERYRLVIGVWDETTKLVTKALTDHLERVQPNQHDGQLRRARQHQPDPPACGYARPDGQHLR